MNIAIIIAKKDPASLNIKKALENYDLSKLNTKLYIIEKESIYSENIDKEIKADLFIFASKHKAESGIPTLTAHSPGNWHKAELGGKDNTLCIAPANYLKETLLELKKLAPKSYQVTPETIHHGPYLEKPAMFVEIGSTEKQWKDENAGKVVAKVIINVLSKKIKKYKTAIAFGSNHYCAGFSKILFNSDIAIGNICPKYQIDNLNENTLIQAYEKNYPKAEFALIDWKGLNTKQRDKIINLLEKNNIPWKKTKDIKTST